VPVIFPEFVPPCTKAGSWNERIMKTKMMSITTLAIILGGGAILFAPRHLSAQTNDVSFASPKILYYFCPMHPSVKSDQPGDCPQCGMPLQPVYDEAKGTNAPTADVPTNGVMITTDFIERLMDEAQTNNPGFLAASSRADSATANVASVRSWENPTFMIGESLFSPEGFDAAQEGDLTYGISQKLPLWGNPSLNRHVAEAAASVRHAETDFRFRQLRRDVMKQLLATALAEREVQIGEQDLAWLQVTAKEIEARYQAGQSSVADTLQIQNEAAERNDRLRTDRLMLGHERVSLNRLLNRDFSSSWPLLQLPDVFPVVPFSEALISLALTNEPQIKVMQQEITEAEAAAKLTRRSRLPDVSVGVQGNQYSGDGGFRSGTFTLSVSLPWFNESKYKKDYQREQDAQKAAEHDRDDQVLMVREELHHLTLDIENQRREALLYRDEITTRAEQMLASRLADWEAGRGTLRDILDARRMWLDSQLTAAQAIAGEQQDVAELLLWTGLENTESLTPLINEPPVLHHHEDN
jgi:cobalt-zinc-cadmium efflux system outer membrane protein